MKRVINVVGMCFWGFYKLTSGCVRLIAFLLVIGMGWLRRSVFSSMNWRQWLIPIVLVVMFLWGMLTSAVLLSKMSLIEFIIAMAPQEHLSGVNILAFGIDDTKSVQRSDTIMVLHIDNKKDRIGVLSIPRDTRVNVEGHGLTRINHSYAYGGTELLQKTVSDFLNVPIDYFVKINLGQVKDFIDQIGGLSVDVEKDLHYEDKAGDLTINLAKGAQILDGEKTIQFLRFRHDKESDIGRIRRQQTLLEAMADKIFSVKSLVMIPKWLGAMSSTIETNLSTQQMVGLASQFSDVYRTHNIEKATVPGAITLLGGAYYWRPDIPALDRLIRQVIFNFDSEGTEKNSKVKTVDSKSSDEARRRMTINEVRRLNQQTDVAHSKLGDLNVMLKVEVLNGYGQQGAATRAAGYLKELGVKIPNVANAGSFTYQRTQIVDWRGNVSHIVALAKEMAIDPSQIIVYDRPNKAIDATIVLGEDWERICEKIERRKR